MTGSSRGVNLAFKRLLRSFRGELIIRSMDHSFLTKKIIVTGAAGMIGSGLVRALNNAGFSNLVLVDELGKSLKWKNLLGKLFIEVIHPSHLFEYLKGREGEFSAILHMGACSDTTETDADFLLENNFRFTIRLAEIALKNKIRFIYASSAATYGDGSLGFDDCEESLEKLKPLNMYGFSKHLVDLWMKREGVLKDVVGLKYFNVFGPNEAHKAHMSSFLSKVASNVEKGEKVSLFKSNDPKNFLDGEQKRDFIYVKDAVKMTLGFLEKNEGGIFNIGMGKASSWNEIAKCLFKAYGQRPKIEYVEMPKHLTFQYQNYTKANMDKFFKAFPNYSLVPLEEAVQDYAHNYLATGEKW